MAATAEIKAIITAKDEASNTIESFGKKASQTALGVGAAFTALAVAGVAAGVMSYNAFAEAEKQQKMLEHAVVNVTHATREQLQQTMDLATALEKKGVLDADNIKQGLAQLSTFGLSNKAVQALGGSLADLAVNQFGVAATGEQLSDSANMIAKALNGQFGILEKSGIRFTDAQKAMIEFGTEEQKVAAINEGFQQNLKYTNDIARTTSEGALAALNVSFGNLQETVGGVIAKALVPLVDKIKPIIDGIIAWAEKNPELTEKIVLATGALIAFAGAIGVAALAVSAIAAIGGGWVVLIVAGVLALAGAIIWLVEKFVGWQNVWNGLVSVYNTYIKPALMDLWSTIQTQLLPVLQEFWDKNKNWIIPALQALAIVIGVVILGSILAFIGILKVVVQAISWLGQGFTWVVEQIKNGIAFIVEKATYLKNHFWEVIGSILGFFATLPIKMPFYVASAVMWVVNYIRNIDWGGIWNTIYNALTNMLSKIPGAFMNMINGIRNLDWGSIGKSIANAVLGFMEGAINGAFAGLPGAPKVRLPRFARGVENFGGGLAIVGERGPELVNLPKGSDVIPNNQIATTGGGSTTININVGLMTGSAIERREAAMKMFEDLQDIASQRGQTVGQLIGA